MTNWQRYKTQIIELIKLASPILIAQVAQNSMGLTDTIMAGRVSAKDMAAISVGASIWFPLLLFGQGLLLALPPTISYLNGSGKRKLIAHQVRQGIWIAVTISIPIFLIVYNSRFIINLMGMDAELANITEGYLKVMAFGALPYLLMMNFRCLNDGIAKTKPAMVIAFTCLLLNIPLNYIFIYGSFGVPAFGAVGCGIATMILNWVAFLLIILYCYNVPSQRDLNIFEQIIEKPNPKTLNKLVRLGFPIAVSICCEVLLFCIISLLISPFGAEIIASHQIALNTSSFIYMLPMSISMATTILVGQSLGAGNALQAKQFTFCALSLGLTVTLFTATITLLFRQNIASIFVSNQNVIIMASSLLIFAAVYQFSDTTQTIIGGALRGYKDTKSVLWISLFGYWVVGMPVGYVLGLTDWIVPHMTAAGFWIGFVVCLTTVACLLFFRLRHIQRLPEEILFTRLEKIK
ncbi:MATE family efflux transporter [Gallibacterium genomosp. 3]|uniref:Multidrug-efflux transporter n=1 Tax=Gallibacterium genomosp. 3 TaxID=505345 RepID=A0A1A7PXC6_9PAST|nr:MATE family efflux transporter [Gallibacterium genomosp. 3]OBX06401.1 multidrug transporter MatE [Gallibacterium genomosp. 3]